MHEGMERRPQPYAPVRSEPDWQALADQHDARTRARRRRKLWMSGAGAVLGVAGVVAGAVAVTAKGDTSAKSAGAPVSASASLSPSTSPSPSPSPSASTSPKPTATATPTATPSPTRAPVTTPTVPGKSNVLADHTGHADLPMGPNAGLKSVSGGYALSLRGSTDSYAESADGAVRLDASFTVSAWVYNDAADGSRTAISEGAGTTSDVDLGRDDSNGKKSWLLRVRTADGTTAQVRSASTATVAQWTLLTASYDATAQTITLYVNGTSAGSAQASGLATGTGSGPFELGRSRRKGAWTSPWAGVIGHIQVWDKALSPTEAARVKSSGGAGPSAPPIASWLV